MERFEGHILSILTKSNLSDFFLLLIILMSLSKKINIPTFSSKNFSFSCYVSVFDLLFICSMRKGFSFILLHVGITICWKKTIRILSISILITTQLITNVCKTLKHIKIKKSLKPAVKGYSFVPRDVDSNPDCAAAVVCWV